MDLFNVSNSHILNIFKYFNFGLYWASLRLEIIYYIV
jgi:hypothetical protein